MNLALILFGLLWMGIGIDYSLDGFFVIGGGWVITGIIRATKAYL